MKLKPHGIRQNSANAERKTGYFFLKKIFETSSRQLLGSGTANIVRQYHVYFIYGENYGPFSVRKTQTL